jgi:GxxExxY protein
VLKDQEELARIVVDCGYRLHRELGPGLMESVYESVSAGRLSDAGLSAVCQRPIDIHVDGKIYPCAFRADIIVNDALLIELKSVENLAPVHIKQTLTYIRLLKMPLGLLINFGTATFKEGTRRIMNNSVA